MVVGSLEWIQLQRSSTMIKPLLLWEVLEFFEVEHWNSPHPKVYIQYFLHLSVGSRGTGQVSAAMRYCISHKWLQVWKSYTGWSASQAVGQACFLGCLLNPNERWSINSIGEKLDNHGSRRFPSPTWKRDHQFHLLASECSLEVIWPPTTIRL